MSYENEGIAMKFTGGQSCWKGPQRSTTVIFECHTQNQIRTVSEPSMCVYEFIFQSPLACNEKEIQNLRHILQNQFKTEL